MISIKSVLLLISITMSYGVAMTFPKMGSDETKESIDAWLVKTKGFLRAVPDYKPYVDATWIAKKADDTRGFKDGPGTGDPPVVPLADQAVTKNEVINAQTNPKFRFNPTTVSSKSKIIAI